MILTLAFDFDYSLCFSIYTSLLGFFIIFCFNCRLCFPVVFLNFGKSKMFKIFTIIIGAVLIIDLGMLFDFLRETALIEVVPVLFALIIFLF